MAEAVALELLAIVICLLVDRCTAGVPSAICMRSSSKEQQSTDIETTFEDNIQECLGVCKVDKYIINKAMARSANVKKRLGLFMIY